LITGLSPNTPYYFRVKANGTNYSPSISVTTSSLAVLSANAVFDNQAVSWLVEWTFSDELIDEGQFNGLRVNGVDWNGSGGISGNMWYLWVSDDPTGLTWWIDSNGALPSFAGGGSLDPSQMGTVG
jgi:hypothetical protein